MLLSLSVSRPEFSGEWVFAAVGRWRQGFCQWRFALPGGRAGELRVPAWGIGKRWFRSWGSFEAVFPAGGSFLPAETAAPAAAATGRSSELEVCGAPFSGFLG